MRTKRARGGSPQWCCRQRASARALARNLLGLVIDLAGDELGAAEVDQGKYDVVSGAEVSGHINENLANSAWKCRKFRNRHLSSERVVETAELQTPLRQQVHAAGVVESDRDLLSDRGWRCNGGRRPS